MALSYSIENLRDQNMLHDAWGITVVEEMVEACGQWKLITEIATWFAYGIDLMKILCSAGCDTAFNL